MNTSGGPPCRPANAGLSHAAGSRLVVLLGIVLGCSFFSHYLAAGLTTAHYDAKAHLVVARRIIDSEQPGYLQMGAHWLPLVHLLYLPFVTSDALYRSAVGPSLLSVLCYVVSGWLVYRLASRATGASYAGLFAAVILLANPNLLYIQSCPLTEPVTMALVLGSMDALLRWRESARESVPWLAAVLAALGALCRYEAWLFLAGVFLLLANDWRTRRIARRATMRAGAAFAGLFAVPVLLHFAYVYLTVRDTFLLRVARGNPVPYETYRRPLLSLLYHAGELLQISSVLTVALGVAGVIFCLVRPERRRLWGPLLLLWVPSLMNVAALFWGLMYRVRYSVLLLPALAVFGSLLLCSQVASRRALAVLSATAMCLPWLTWYFPQEWRYHAYQAGPGVLLLPPLALALFSMGWASRRLAPVGAALCMLCVAGMYVPVLNGEDRAILSETREHEFMEPERQKVIQLLRNEYDGTRILLDMGRQAPLVYDSGLPVREFVYNEGEQRHWKQALTEPRRVVGWICIEKGDDLSNVLRVDPHWVDGYALAVHTDNLLLYRLRPEERDAIISARRLE